MKLAEVRRYALSLPEVTEEPHHHLSSFRVRGRIFVTVPPAGHEIRVFVGEEDRDRALALYPQYVQKLWWGERVMGLTVALPAARPAAVRDLVRRAWESKAPRALLRALGPPRRGAS
jgi:hypothetical protein